MNGSKVLKLVCSAMLQSWRNTGLGPEFRYTEMNPTKTGVAGMIACALGIPRGNSEIKRLENNFELYLSKKESGSLTDMEGNIPDVLMDFQTIFAPTMLSADGNPIHTPTVTNREYIIAHRFVLYLKTDENVLIQIKDALNNPVWDYYLGSKCCIPAEPVCQGIYDCPKELEDENVYQHIRV